MLINDVAANNSDGTSYSETLTSGKSVEGKVACNGLPLLDKLEDFRNSHFGHNLSQVGDVLPEELKA